MADKETSERIVQLVDKAYGAFSEKNLEQARQYFDEAISMAESHNIATFGLKLNREQLLRTTPADLSIDVPVLQDALEFYKRRKRPLKLLNIYERLILTLALLGRASEAYRYLDEAESFFSSLEETDMVLRDIPERERSKLASVDKLLKFRELQARMQRLRDDIPKLLRTN